MLKDITLGQYFPGKSFIHQLDARAKIIFTALFIVAIFMAKNFPGFAVITLFLLIIIIISKIPFSLVLKSIKPLIFIIIITAVFNIFYSTGEPIFRFYFLKITREGLYMTGIMILRLVLLISGTSMLTYTSSPIMLTDAIEQLLGPLKKVKLPVHELAMMMTIALRFIPTLIEETDKIMNAQKARGADFESGNIIKRAYSLIPILVPLFVSSFRRADELATAMECRCYHGGEGRTKLKVMRYSNKDLIGSFTLLAVICLVVYMNYLNIF